jgi:hypothetical protein
LPSWFGAQEFSRQTFRSGGPDDAHASPSRRSQAGSGNEETPNELGCIISSPATSRFSWSDISYIARFILSDERGRKLGQFRLISRRSKDSRNLLRNGKRVVRFSR